MLHKGVTFSVTGLMDWNALPANVTNIKDKANFNMVLKKQLFKIAYNC